MFDPAQCAHHPGSELKLDRLSRVFSVVMLMIDHLTRDHTEVISLSNKRFFPAKCFPLPLDAALRQQAIFLVS